MLLVLVLKLLLIDIIAITKFGIFDDFAVLLLLQLLLKLMQKFLLLLLLGLQLLLLKLLVFP